jgi:hypothetical protein
LQFFVRLDIVHVHAFIFGFFKEFLEFQLADAFDINRVA